MVTMYSFLGEHLNTTVKLGPLADRVSCASVSGEEERLTAHLALVLLSTVLVVFVMAEVVVDVGVVVVVVMLVVAEIVDMVVVVVVVVVVIVVADVSMWLLVFGQPLKHSFMCPLKVLLW